MLRCSSFYDLVIIDLSVVRYSVELVMRNLRGADMLGYNSMTPILFLSIHSAQQQQCSVYAGTYFMIKPVRERPLNLVVKTALIENAMARVQAEGRAPIPDASLDCRRLGVTLAAANASSFCNITPEEDTITCSQKCAKGAETYQK